MVYNVEKMLKEHRDKIGDAEAKNIEEALEETKKAIADGNAGADQRGDRQADRRPATSWPRRCTSTAGPQPGGPAGQRRTAARRRRPEPEKPKDNVVDAEFVDVDDKK